MSEDRRLTRIETKIDDIGDQLGKIEVTISNQALILQEHQRRSLANEKMVELLSKELKPVILHVEMVKLSIKILAYVLGCGFLIRALSSLFGK